MKRILVVDDEAQIRTMLTQMLELEGYTVHTGENGEEGLALVGRYAFDLVITDMIMPVKDGLKFIMELIRDYPDLKILAISGGGAIKAIGLNGLSLTSNCPVLKVMRLLSMPPSRVA